MALAPVKKIVRLVVPAGIAKPSPQIGQALGSLGINMMQFCKQFNERTKNYKEGIPLRVLLTARTDQTFEFSSKSPQTSWLLKKCAGVEKGSGKVGHEWVGRVHVKQLYEVAKIKMAENEGQAHTLEGICRCLLGQMKSIGLAIDKRPDMM